MKVEIHSSLETPLEYNQDKTPSCTKVRYNLSTILGVMEILCSLRLVLEGKTGKEIPESSRLELFEKF